MAVDYLSALNAGSGLNNTQIIDSIVNAQKAPEEEQIKKNIEETNLKISSLGELKKEINAFNTNIATIENDQGITLNSTDTDIVLSSITGKTLNEFDHSITVSQLATSQVLKYEGFSSTSSTVTAQTLTFSFGSYDNAGTTFTANATENAKYSTLSTTVSAGTTISQLASQINNMKIGVTANVLQVSAGSYTLEIKAPTGSDRQLKISSTAGGDSASTSGTANGTGSYTNVGVEALTGVSISSGTSRIITSASVSSGSVDGTMDGTYTNIPASGGSGSGATFNFTISGGSISNLAINNPGAGYVDEEDLTILGSALNNGSAPGNNITINIDSINANTTYSGKTQSATNGSGSGATFTIGTNGNGDYSTVTITNPGNSYTAGDTITIPGTSLGGTSSNDLTLSVSSSVGTYNASSGASGSGMTFNITKNANGTYSASVASSGTGYKTGDTIVIPGTALGGSTAANDLTLTITANQSLGYNTALYSEDINDHRVSVGVDANLQIDGISIVRNTNTIEDLVEAVSIELKDVTSKTETIKGNYDSSAALNTLTSFVDELNFLRNFVKKETDSGLNGGTKGSLNGDPFIRSLKNYLDSVTTKALPGYAATPTYMSFFGVMTQLDGTIGIDTTKFETFFKENPEQFAALTSTRATTDNDAITSRISSFNLNDFVAGAYQFNLSGGTGTVKLDSDQDGSFADEGTTITLTTDATNKEYFTDSGDAAGMILGTTLTSVTDANVFMGRSLIASLKTYLDSFLFSSDTTDLDVEEKIKNFNSDIQTFNDQQSKLDERMANIRENYVEKFTAMESTVSSFKKTGNLLTNFMDAMTADK